MIWHSSFSLVSSCKASFRNLRSYWAFNVDDIIYNGSSRTVRLTYTIYLYEVFLDQIITPGFNITARPHY